MNTRSFPNSPHSLPGRSHSATTSAFPGLWTFCLLQSAFCLLAAAQPAAFTYQGSMSDYGSPADGIYDLRFAIYDDATVGVQQGVAITNAATVVSNGLFTVTLNFGASVFDGGDPRAEQEGRGQKSECRIQEPEIGGKT